MSRIIANFVLKFPNVHYRGNEGQSFVKFNEAIKLHDLENPLLDARFLSIALT